MLSQELGEQHLFVPDPEIQVLLEGGRPSLPFR